MSDDTIGDIEAAMGENRARNERTRRREWVRSLTKEGIIAEYEEAVRRAGREYSETYGPIDRTFEDLMDEAELALTTLEDAIENIRDAHREATLPGVRLLRVAGRRAKIVRNAKLAEIGEAIPFDSEEFVRASYGSTGQILGDGLVFSTLGRASSSREFGPITSVPFRFWGQDATEETE